MSDGHTPSWLGIAYIAVPKSASVIVAVADTRVLSAVDYGDTPDPTPSPTARIPLAVLLISQAPHFHAGV